MARRKKEEPIYIYLPMRPEKGKQKTLAHTYCYSDTSSLTLAILTLASEALWQAPH